MGEALRVRAAQFLQLAGKDHLGRRQWDPMFEAVTEGRQGPRYSACADVGHWLLYRLGFRCLWINRAEFAGWADQVNLSRLCAKAASGSNPAARLPVAGDLVRAGDILVVEAHDPDRSHVLIVYGNGSDGTVVELTPGAHLKTCEYGQWDPRYARPGGKLSCHVVDVLAGKVMVGKSVLDSVLDLDALDPPDPELLGVPRDYVQTEARAMRVLAVVGMPRMRGHDVQWWAEELKLEGLDPGLPIDVFGPKCERATQAWQNRHRLPATGTVGDADWLEMVTHG